MRTGFQYFDKVFLINLQHRTDRLARCKAQFDKYRVADLIELYQPLPPTLDEFNSYKRPGLKTDIGNFGCIRSHINIIQQAKDHDWEKVLILEDDVKFVNQNYIDASIKQLSLQDWNLFYLGSNLHEPLVKVDENLLRLKRGFATHAVAYHCRFYDTFLTGFANHEIGIIDVWLEANGQAKTECFCSFPISAVQEKSYSDIAKQEVDYNWMINKFNQYTDYLV